MPLLFVLSYRHPNPSLQWLTELQVAGEIPSFSVLKWGFIVGVSLVGILYLLVVCLFVRQSTQPYCHGWPG